MSNTDSILDTIKTKIGINPDYDDAFDVHIITNINTTFERLKYLGIGPDNGFRITGSTETWDMYLTNDEFIDSVIDYISMKVKMLFAPPETSFGIEAIKEQLSELEFFLKIKSDEIMVQNNGSNQD